MSLDSSRRGVALVGFMGAGKSTVGAALAELLGLPFVDLDARVEQAAGVSVQTLFAREGEAGFRAREQRQLQRCLSGAPVVLACGGGAPCQPGAMQALKAWGLTVFLQAPVELLQARVGQGSGRPLWSSGVDALLATRTPVYAQAHLTLSADATPQALAQQIARSLS